MEKNLSSMAREYLKNSYISSTENELCHFVTTPWAPRKLCKPEYSCDITCEFCGGHSHTIVLMDQASKSKEKLWVCMNSVCKALESFSDKKNVYIAPKVNRAIEWPVFCLENGLGDSNHDVKFETIHQNKTKMEYLAKFAKNPYGIYRMQGKAGTGKSYAALGVCEFITRTNPSCIYITQKQMSKKWLEAFKDPGLNTFVERLERVNCLVIDDFGTGEMSSNFMTFFMDLINTRMQWKDRGTIITTNLDNDTFSSYCGEALYDRIRVGIKFQFKDKSRRKEIII